MVTIRALHRKVSVNGCFFSFEACGNPEIIQSHTTGRFYATVRRCFISTTLNEEEAEKLIGTTLPGYIKRVACPPYEYKSEETGEVVLLMHRYVYEPAEVV